MDFTRNISKERLNGVITIDEFLGKNHLIKDYKEKGYEPMKIGKKVVVIGEEGIVVHAARKALNYGSQVHIIYPRSEEEFSASINEVQIAKKEGIKFDFLTKAVEVIGDKDGQVIGLKCVELMRTVSDMTGMKKFEELEDSRFIIESETVIISAAI